MLSDSILFGAATFMFSTIGITIVGKILPQAYFLRHAIAVGSRLVPFVLFCQKVWYPVAKPTALVLDRWLGSEEISYFRKMELLEVIRQHMAEEDADLNRREGIGVLNFLSLDDLPVGQEGEKIDPRSVLSLPIALDLPVFPAFSNHRDDAFLKQVQSSGRKWVVITDTENVPRVVLDADGFCATSSSPTKRPTRTHIVVDQDLILLWNAEPGIITGGDLLGRMLRGIAKKVPQSQAARTPLN